MTRGKSIGFAAAALAVAATTWAAGMPGQGTWERTLKPRDLDGNGVTDAFYDTALDVTWLRNADLAGGGMFWSQANAWAADLVFGGYSDWRLPVLIDTGRAGCNFGYSGTDCGYNVLTKNGLRTFSELAHLFYVTLGNVGYCDSSGACGQPGWGLSNTGAFENLRDSFYWTSVIYGPRPDLAWYFYAYSEYQSFGHQNHLFYMLPVRTGDVAAVASVVPEVGSAALMLAGGAGLALAGLRRRRSPMA